MISLSLRLAHGAAGEDRWPDFATVAVRFGIGSMLSLQLFVQNETLGALNLCATTPYGFSAADETIAEVQAIASRDVIGQAKGILMARHHTTAARAFDMLVAASQQTNLKLVHVARWLIAKHEHSPRDASPAARTAAGARGVRL